MRFAFRALPDPGRATVRARPIIDVVVEGLDIAPQACLLDSGATAIRFGLHVAELCGVELSDAPASRLAVGGTLVSARMADVDLMVADSETSYAWTAPAWFCEPWSPGFGLLGLTGFFDHFEVTIAAYEERIDLPDQPLSRLTAASSERAFPSAAGECTNRGPRPPCGATTGVSRREGPLVRVVGQRARQRPSRERAMVARWGDAARRGRVRLGAEGL